MIERNQKGFDGSRWAEMGGGSGQGGAHAYGGGSAPRGSVKSGAAGRGGPPKSSGAKRAAANDPYGDRLMSDGRVMCSKCGRGFAKDRIDKHE